MEMAGGSDAAVLPRVWAARATALALQFTHCVHCYHTVDVWSRDGRFMLYAGFDEPERSSIVIRDTQTGREHVIGDTPIVDYHTSSGQRWVFDDRAVLFKQVGDDGVVCPAIVERERPGEVRRLVALSGRCIRHVIDHGRIAIAVTACDDESRGRIERIDLETQETHTLLTTDDAVRMLPSGLRDAAGQWRFSHPVPNADESMFFCKLMKRVPDAAGFVAFFVFEPDTGEVRCFGDRISGHPAWMNDGRHILNVKSPRDGSDNRHLVLVDAKTGEDRRLIDLPIEGPGHPTVSPDGQFVVTDAFVADGRQSPIYIIDVPRRQAFEIARLDHHFVGGKSYEPNCITRGQPHPVWAPCGTRIVVNCNHGGDHFGLVVLEDFISRE